MISAKTAGCEKKSFAKNFALEFLAAIRIRVRIRIRLGPDPGPDTDSSWSGSGYGFVLVRISTRSGNRIRIKCIIYFFSNDNFRNEFIIKNSIGLMQFSSLLLSALQSNFKENIWII